MKWNARTIHLLAKSLLIALIGAVAEGAVAQDERLIAPRTQSAPVIDADLSDPCWRDAAQAADFHRMGEPAKATEKTTVLISHDEGALYLAAEVVDAKVVARHRVRDEGTWEDDCVELFMDVERLRRDQFHFVFSASGMVYDARLGDKAWDASPDVKVATRVTEHGWAIEVAIPFAALAVGTPTQGDVWDIKLAREDYDAPGAAPRLSSWTRTGKTFHDAGAFGRLVFIDVNRAANGDFSRGLMLDNWVGGGWRLSPATKGGELTLGEALGRDGSPCARVLVSGYTQVQTCVTVQPRRSYRLSAWVNRDDLPSNARLQFFTDRENRVDANRRAAGWQQMETFVTVGDAKYLPITWTASGVESGSFLLDDVRVEEIDNTPRSEGSVCYTGNAAGVLAKHNRRVAGSYSFFDLASNAMFFPQAEQRGSADVELHGGWIAFDKGKLTDGDASFTQYHQWTVSPGKTMIFDLGEDRFVTDVELLPVERRLSSLRVYLKPANEAFFTLVAAPDVRPGNMQVAGLDAHARWVRIDYNGECGWREVRIWGRDQEGVVPPRAMAAAAVGAVAGGPALADPQFAIFPAPKQVTYGVGCFMPSRSVRIAIPSDADDRLRAGVESFAADLRATTGIAIAVDDGDGADIVITAGPLAELVGKGDEAYTLVVDAGGARITGATSRGVIHGLSSLLQCVTRMDSGVGLRHVDVVDWPHFPYRGMQLWARMLDDPIVNAGARVMARSKMNELLLMGAGPSAVPMSKQLWTMGMDTAIAAGSMPSGGWYRNSIELNPGEAAADLPSHERTNPCPSDPRTWEAFDKEVAKAALFPGRYVHINCDEMYQEHKGARWNVCALCTARNLSGGDLFADMIVRMHRQLAKIGKTPQMLGTMYTIPWKMQGAFEKLPRDIPIAIWHPWTQEGLEKLGYRTMEFLDGDGWDIDPNTPSVIGGFVPGDGGLKVEKAALFAEALWTGKYPDVNDPATLRRLADVMSRIHEMSIGATLPSRDAGPERFVPIDLPGNCPLTDGAQLLDIATGSDLSVIAGEMSLNGVPTRIAPTIAVLENRGALDARYARDIRIPVNRRAASLVFLHALTRPLAWTYAAQLTHAGNYFIEYLDGSRVWMPIRYKCNILEYDAVGGTTAGYKSQLITLPEAIPAWRGTMPNGATMLLCQAEWVNPYPDKAVAAVVMTSSSRMHGSRVALFALTAVLADGHERGPRAALLPPAPVSAPTPGLAVMDIAGGAFESETNYRAPDGTTIESSGTYTLEGATLIARMKVGHVTIDNNLGWQVYGEDPQTLTVTFPQPRTVAGVELRGMPESPEYVFANRLGPSAYRVEVSSDGETWHRAVVNEDYTPDRDGAMRHTWDAQSLKAVRIVSLHAGRRGSLLRGIANLAVLTP